LAVERHGRRLDAWLLVLGLAGLAAWSMLALGGSGLTLPAVCSAGGTPGTIPFDLALALNSPAKLASDWALMVAAMMSPVVIGPLRHVRERSFAKRRPRAMLLFIAGYAAVWMAAGVPLQALALALRWAGPGPALSLGLAAAAAMVWQVSPGKQWCLNRCHRQPSLAAFGAAADRDAFGFGLTNGAACVGACWALMLLPLFAGGAHLAVMLAITVFIFAERLEGPAPLAWRWRGTGKAWRIVAAWACRPWAARNRIKEVSR
jgi:predicted metal-binding membrane protein